MNRNYLIVIGLGVATIIAFLLINYFSPSGAIENDVAELDKLKKELESLDETILEIELINNAYEQQMENLKGVLDQKYTQLSLYEDKIKQMENKVDEMEKNGELDKKTIEDLKAQILEARGKLVDSYKVYYQKEIDLLVYEKSRITAGMDSAIMEVNKVDSLLVESYRINERMEKALLDCNDAKSMNEVTLPEVAELKATNFIFSSISKDASGKIKQLESSGKRLEYDKLERLNVCFDLSGNSLVPNQDMKVYLFLYNPLKELYRSKAYGGQTVKDGVTAYYTRSNELTYDPKIGKYNVCMDFLPDEGTNFMGGRHRVVIVHNGVKIGTKRFWISK